MDILTLLTALEISKTRVKQLSKSQFQFYCKEIFKTHQAYTKITSYIFNFIID